MIRYSTEVIVNAMKDLKRTGLVDEVVKTHGIKEGILRAWAKKAGIEVPRKTPKRDWELIKTLIG